jgi:hypothetical protein
VNTLESTFQIFWRTKYVPSLAKIHWRMLILECSQGSYGRTDGIITISLPQLLWRGDKKGVVILCLEFLCVGTHDIYGCFFYHTDHMLLYVPGTLRSKLGTYLVLKIIWNPIDFQGHWSKVKVTGSNFNHVTSLWTLESTNIFQWILTKHGTYLVLRRVWNPVDFQGHRSKVKVTGSNFKWILTEILLRTKYVPSLVKIHLKFDPVTLTFDLWPWKSTGFQTLLRTKYVPCLVKIHWKMFVESTSFNGFWPNLVHT